MTNVFESPFIYLGHVAEMDFTVSSPQLSEVIRRVNRQCSLCRHRRLPVIGRVFRRYGIPVYAKHVVEPAKLKQVPCGYVLSAGLYGFRTGIIEFTLTKRFPERPFISPTFRMIDRDGTWVPERLLHVALTDCPKYIETPYAFVPL